MAIRIPTEDSAPTVAFEDAVHFVMELLGSVADFRDPRGKQIELKGTLALAILATTTGHPGYTDIEQWGKDREENLIPLLGLTRAPSDTTIGRILQGVAPEALREVLRRSAAMILSGRRKLVTAKDGKTMRAARVDGRSAHMVSLVEQNTGVIMDADYCRRGEGELAAARRLEAKAAAGKAEIAVETGDALYTNSADAAGKVEEGGHYLLKVKKTPPSSLRTSSSASPTTPPSSAGAGRSTSSTAA